MAVEKLENIARKAVRPFVIGGASAYLILNTLIPISCAKPEPVNPPAQTENYTAPKTNETTVVKPTPEIAEPYRLYAPTATLEEFEFFNSALEKSYERVKDVYGAVPNIAVLISPNKSKYDVLTRDVFKDLYGENANDIPDNRFPYPISHFKISGNNNLLVHEISHVVNESLFPTYHSWFDEGMAMYASGEINRGVEMIKSGNYPIALNEWKNFKDNPHAYWESQKGYYGAGSSNTPTHLIGAQFFYLMVLDYGLTPDKNRDVIMLLTQRYQEGKQELSRSDVEKAYETALGVSLNPLFNIIGDGIRVLYGLYPSPSKDMTKTMNEF